jgi:hypothetical protein
MFKYYNIKDNATVLQLGEHLMPEGMSDKEGSYTVSIQNTLLQLVPCT